MCESIPLPGDSIRDQTWSPICWRSPTSPLKRVTCSLTIPKRVTKTQNFQDLYFLVSPISFRCSKTSQKTSGSSFTAHETINLLQPTSPPLWVSSKNNGFSPKSSILSRGYSMIFTLHFGGKFPIFGSTPLLSTSENNFGELLPQTSGHLQPGLLPVSGPWDPITVPGKEWRGCFLGPWASRKNGGWKGKVVPNHPENFREKPRWRWNIYYNLDRMDW